LVISQPINIEEISKKNIFLIYQIFLANIICVYIYLSEFLRKMRKALLGCFLIYSLGVLGQENRFGITFGTTNYITDTNWLFSKSGVGFTLGAMGTKSFSDRFELFIEINYNYHRVDFVGRETATSIPEDIRFRLEEFGIPIIINYNYLLLEDFRLGVNAGPSFHFIHNYVLLDETKESYLLDPLLTEPKYLEFDTYNDDISFNMFAVFGLNVQYQENFMASLRYYYGITDPYRRAPVVSPVLDISGQDSYFSFTITYFF
jgi:hypothetical protein